MRQICVDEWPDHVESREFRLHSPAGGWFPVLEVLSWCITESNLPHVDLFFSPHLRKISISVSAASSLLWWDLKDPRGILPTIASAISTLPTSTLQFLSMEDNHYGTPWAYFKDSLSSVALCCGPSLAEFNFPVPLSDAAISHLIRLPHLRTWRVEGPPPAYFVSSLPHIFPSLTEFILGEGAASGWLSLFEHSKCTSSAPQHGTPPPNVKESLKSLKIKEPNSPGPTIDISLVTTIQMFRNLVCLDVWAFCHDDDKGQCTFKLDNDEVVALVVALPQLESLLLGYPYFENTCATTVACLLSISVYCVKLRQLGIHFNTTNIVDDFKNISGDPRFQELLPLPKCPLSRLEVHEIRLDLDEPGIEVVANGMIDIFPCLERCEAVEEELWFDISDQIMEFQRMSTLPERRW